MGRPKSKYKQHGIASKKAKQRYESVFKALIARWVHNQSTMTTITATGLVRLRRLASTARLHVRATLVRNCRFIISEILQTNQST